LSWLRNTDFKIKFESIRRKVVTYVETLGLGSSTGSGWTKDAEGGEPDGGENVAWTYSSESKSGTAK